MYPEHGPISKLKEKTVWGNPLTIPDVSILYVGDSESRELCGVAMVKCEKKNNTIPMQEI